jgi:hypothetical protein
VQPGERFTHLKENENEHYFKRREPIVAWTREFVLDIPIKNL